MSRKIILLAFILSFLITPAFMADVWAWSNGGYSADPSNPDYGTHDWIAHHALDWLPDQEKQYILDNLAAYLYGTELPDNNQAADGIGDTTKHHIYYWSNENLQDDAAAVRASEEYYDTLKFLKAKDYAKAAKNAGIMSHYIADMAVFSHVMGSGTDWGAEVHHSDYETYVNGRTSSYSAEFNFYLSFDGSLITISAYDAAKNLAYDTTFDVDGDLTCVWMDRNYNWDNPSFKNRATESLNLAVNYITDVLHTLYTQGQNSQSTTAHIVINEVEQNPPGTDAGYEWIELYNPTSNVVDIGGWTVSTTTGVTVTLKIPSGTRITAGGYSVVTYGSQWLDNEDESVILRDSGGNEVDRTPTLSNTNNDGRSWQRYPNGRDTDSSSDWSFRTSTKGVSNGGEAPEPGMDKTPPTTTDNYDGKWHNTDFTITLTATDDLSGVDETYYKINDEPTRTVSADGQPLITTEDANNKLEYWSVDNAGNEESHHILIGIKLDKTAPAANAGVDQTANEDTVVTFDGSASQDENGIATYTWTFIDATPQTLSGKNPTYTFATPGTYIITLKVTDPSGNYATDTVIITVLDVTKPIANAGSDRTVNEDTPITLDGSASSDNVGITAYTWTFTDVTTKTLTGEKPTYTFNMPGVYTITLNVTDATGNWATDTIVITVADVTKPVANAGQDKTVNVGTTVSFDASGSSDNVGIVSYEWDFGDGTMGIGATTTHTYTKPGTYTVTLMVRDKAGNSVTDTMTVTIQEVAAPAPIPWWTIGVIVAVGTAIALTALRLLRHKT